MQTKRFINCTNEKVPVDLTTGLKINHLDPYNQLDFEAAVNLANQHGANVSFVLNGCGIWCLDIDKCINNGALSPIGSELLALTTGHSVLIEQSVSGAGLHVWGRYEGELPDHRNKITSMGIELYTDERHIILGSPIPQSTLKNFKEVLTAQPCNQLFEQLVSRYFAPTFGEAGTVDLLEEDNKLTWSQILRRKCATASNPFSNTFTLEYLQTELSLSEYDQDRSGLDMALANHLAFHTKKNFQASLRLFYNSHIADLRKQTKNGEPDKFTRSAGRYEGNRITYGQKTIIQAIADCNDIYQTPGEFKEAKQAERIEEIKQSVEGERGTPDSPAGYYLRDFVCVYNGDSPSYVCARTGNQLGKQSFKDCFRVDGFEFEQAFPDRILAGKEYTPGQPPIYMDNNGLKILNEYVPGPLREPITTENKELLDRYFSAICPNDNYRKWLLQWCGHAVQKPSVKILTAVILTGREQGTGKSTLAVLLSKAVGKGNVARISNNTLRDQYNEWLSTAIIGISEELSTQYSSKSVKEKIKETVKDWVTTRDISIRKMYKSTCNAYNAINAFLFTTNNIDAFPMDADDRRFFVLEVIMNMAIKVLIHEGLYTKINHQISDGQIADYFHNIDLIGFDPSAEAPTTETKEEMIEYTRDDAMQEIQDAIDNPGITCANEYLVFSSLLADDLGVSTREVSKALRDMGYKRHRSSKCIYWLKGGNLPPGTTHATIHTSYELLKR